MVAAIAPASCTSTDEDIVYVIGTVEYIDLEGGFYGIIGNDGKHYDPINLGPEFQEDCLRIYFEAKIREDVASTHMWGIPVEITRIEELARP